MVVANRVPAARHGRVRVHAKAGGEACTERPQRWRFSPLLPRAQSKPPCRQPWRRGEQGDNVPAMSVTTGRMNGVKERRARLRVRR
jgi:hypothetical protein